ncbi:hypothetical protein [Roseateles toxinivorans]|uniref:Uncharacterized protein n=1 Tax=Roseateles toxinivorans TaxID=270368 RepID=A0A4V3CT76_9BURK|nr:hypothetical protein [Roseateles toxinivorans]TDP64094.1 hypothetical protein DES47_104382 [Roseateles toxinivorans]
MWIPASLYEKLPHIYLAISLLTFMNLGLKGLGGFCAMLLALAALRIYTWRRNYRQDSRQAPSRFSRYDEDVTRPASL